MSAVLRRPAAFALLRNMDDLHCLIPPFVIFDSFTTLLLFLPKHGRVTFDIPFAVPAVLVFCQESAVTV